MGEKDGENKVAGGGTKAEVGPAAAVLKLNLHCEGCAKKVKRAVRNFEGVEKVKSDLPANKLTVTGNVDPAWLRERVEQKTKKKVELVSPPPKKAAAAGDEKEKPDKKTEEIKKVNDEKPKKVVNMKIKLHCKGCGHMVEQKLLKNIVGVESVKTDLSKDLVTVTGTMDVNELTTYMQNKLKKRVEVIPAKKDGGGEEKSEKESGGGDKEGKSDGGKESKPAGGEGAKVEVNKFEYNSYNPQTHYATPMYDQSYANQDYGYPQTSYARGPPPPPPMYNERYANQDYGDEFHRGYANHGHPHTSYAAQYASGPPPPPPTYLDTNMFSDENPNGCSLM